MIHYVSTRGDGETVSGASAVIRGLAPDRGLYVPESFPERIVSDELDWPELAAQGYKGIATKVLASFLPDYTKEEIEACVNGAYDSKFDTPEIAPLAKTEKAFFLELWHGGTAAFKDMALAILPYLLKTAVAKTGENKKIVILTATSGDTGKAAMAGFADVPGTEILVFYPKEGVSVVQERQMVTQTGDNVFVFGIRGNFDDAQTGVKDVFRDDDLNARLDALGIRLSSANSINIGRLVPQVAYYVSAYARLVATGEIGSGEKINICVPTGNFGNILAAYYAKQIGVPVHSIICASNENKVLTDFISTGIYDARREFVLTSSPSMDILISSNLERLLWHLSKGESGVYVKDKMDKLDQTGTYDAGDEVRRALSENRFTGGFADMNQAHGAITDMWKNERYLMDTHTAVGYAVYLDYLNRTGDRTKTVIASTASPYKFAGSVAACLGLDTKEREFVLIESIHNLTHLPIPECLRDLDKKPILHDEVIDKESIGSTVFSVSNRYRSV